MIVYRLICDQGHEFDAWFKGSQAYEEQAKAGHIACAVCGSHHVSKAPMAPNLATSPSKAPEAVPTAPAPAGPQELSPGEIMDRMHALARQLRKKVEQEFENVGDRFAKEARMIHYGEAEERGIYGEAKPQEVKDLLEEGIAVAPLPDGPDKAN